MVNLKSGDVIGRGECTHSFKDGIKLSRTHCKFSIDDGEIFITDLNSTNGTLLNQKRIEPNKKIKLEHGNVLVLGDKKFVCHFTDAEILPTHEMESKPSNSNTSKSVSDPAKSHQFAFVASSSELFILMIKNVIFTLLTLGLYTPYARTNVRKYIWKSTSLNSSPFMFKGDPASLRNSYLKIVILIILYLVVEAIIFKIFLHDKLELIIIYNISIYAAYFVFFIWARFGAYCYLVNHTSYRSISFNVKQGGSSEHLKSSIKGSIFTILTLGIYYPFMLCSLEKIRWGKTQYGDLPFKYSPEVKEFFFLWLKGCFLSILTLGFYYPWHTVAMHKYRLSHLKFGHSQFHSSAKGGEYLMVCLKSILLLIVTLGLGAPIVMNLNLAYFFKNASIKGNINFDEIVAAAKNKRPGTFSDAASDILGIESGVEL